MRQLLTVEALNSFLCYLPGRSSDRRDEMLLIHDLARFDICNVTQLSVLIGKHWDRLRSEEEELNKLIGVATLHFMPSCNDCSYTRAGLVRLAMCFEFGESWCKYLRSLPVLR